MFDFISVAFMTFCLRQGVALVIGLCGVVLWLITNELKSPQVKKLVKKNGIIILVFAAFRIIAAFADYKYGFGIGLWSNIVNYLFWLWVLFIFTIQLIRIRKEGGREKTADSLEQIAKEMRLYKTNLQTFITTGG